MGLAVQSFDYYAMGFWGWLHGVMLMLRGWLPHVLFELTVPDYPNHRHSTWKNRIHNQYIFG